VKQTAIRVAQFATQQKKQKRGSCQAPLFAFTAILIRSNVFLGWRWICVPSSMMVASAVVLAGATDIDRRAAKATAGAKAKTTTDNSRLAR
jgi:hypothetical protein